jgi:hypothetical protein
LVADGRQESVTGYGVRRFKVVGELTNRRSTDPHSRYLSRIEDRTFSGIPNFHLYTFFWLDEHPLEQKGLGLDPYNKRRSAFLSDRYDGSRRRHQGTQVMASCESKGRMLLTSSSEGGIFQDQFLQALTISALELGKPHAE